MKFLMETSRELSFAELLRLNGGYGGGSGGSPGKSGSGSYGGSSSGGRYSKSGTRSKGAARKSSRAYSAPSGSLWYLNDERLTVVDGRAYSSLTGFISGGAGSSEADSKEPAKTPQQIADEARKAADKAQGAVDKMDPVSAKKHYIDMGFDSAMAAVLALDDRGELNSNFLRNDETYLVHQIVKKLNSDLKNGNIDYKVGEMQCDDYVQSVLGSAGVNYYEYFAGEAKEKTCAQHIDNLDPNGKYDSSVVEKGSVYVCFMGGGKVAEHCALLVASNDGGFYMADNSSGNWSGNGGLHVDYSTSLAGVESLFSKNYSKFYYQKVTK